MAVFRTANNAYVHRNFTSRTSTCSGGATNSAAWGTSFVSQVDRRKFLPLQDITKSIYVAPAAGGPQVVPIGAATETDTANAVGRQKVKALGAASEPDAANAVTARRSRALTAGTETDTGGTLARAKNKAVAGATEPDAASSVTRRKTRALTAATETDAGGTLAILRGRTVALTAATETDTAGSLGRRKTRAVTGATETDTGTIARRKSWALTAATESDAAGALGKRKVRSVTAALETDTALGVSDRKGLGTAAETDTAGSLGRSHTRALGATAETDTGGALGRSRSRALGTPTETDTAGSLSRKKVVALGTALETDAAVGVSGGGVTYLFTEDYEGTAGAAMSGSNTAWDVFNGAGTRTLESTPTPRYGSTLGRYAGSGIALTKDTTSLPGTTNGGSVRRQLFYRGYYSLDSTTDVALTRMIVFEESVANGGADVAVLRLNANRTMRMLDGTTLVGTATTKALDTNWTRIELKVDQDANTIEVRLWWGADLQSTSTGATNYESQSGTLATNTDMEVFGTGFYASQASGRHLYVEEVGVGYGGWLGPVPTGQTVNLGSGAETDTGSALARRKVKTLGSASEPDTAGSLTRRKVGALTAPTETDAAGALARKKRLALGVAAEVDTAVGVTSGARIVTLGTAFEVDAAEPIGLISASLRWTFIPPSSGTANRHRRGASPAGRLFPRVSGSPIHYCVMIFDAETNPRVVATRRPVVTQMQVADFVYLGPREYEVGQAEHDILATVFPDALVPVGGP